MHVHPSRFGLRTRLLALVLAPALLLGVIGGAAALRERRGAAALAEVRDEVRVLADLTELRRLLLGARAPIEIEVRATALGIDRSTALTLLDVDPLPDDDLDAVAAQLRRLPSDARPFTTSRLDAVRDDAADGADVALIDQFDQLDALAQDRWDRRLSRLRNQVVDTGSRALAHRLDDLEASTLAGSAAGAMVTKLADHWFGSLDDSARAEAARIQIAVAARQFDRSMATLSVSADPSVAAIAEGIADSKPGTPFGDAIDDAVAGRPPAPFVAGADLELVASTFTSSFELFGPLLNLMEGRAARLEFAATVLADEATRSAALALSGVILAIVALLAVSLLVAASLEGPLSRLIEGMRKVGAGDLDVAAIPSGGPAEIAEATDAFNDVVANLSRLEGKVEALAHADLEDQRLSAPLPGPLGEAMEQSFLLLSESIADRAALQARLAFKATHDDLTRLPNRPGALEALDGAIARSSRTGSPLAVAFLDLDGFKAVNDTFGHQTGDDVLCEVARRLDDEARTGDFCARLGGDEFVIIAENVAGVEGAISLGRRVAQRVAEPFVVGPASQARAHLGVSIGIAMRTEANDTPLSILARADAAAYRAKRARSGIEVAEF